MHASRDSIHWGRLTCWVCGALMMLAAPGPNALAASTDYQPHGGMLRFPDVSQDRIAFVYANDIWVVSRDGGVAVPLASPPGQELFPRFSADGETIAFVGNYAGDRDLYTVGVEGGVPRRVTHHPATEFLCDWTPSGDLLFYMNGLSDLPRQTELMTVSPEGGLPRKLPVPYGANGSISADGEWLAYTPHTRDQRTWKRYRGGMATDIWLFNLKDHSSQRITDWEGTDTQPFWHGSKVFYLSDAGPAHRLNIWSYDTSDGTREQVSHFDEYDCKWPSIGPGDNGQGEIVVQNGSALYLINLATGASKSVEIRIPGARPKLRQHQVDDSKYINGRFLSPTAKRVCLEARGDLWTVPVKHGSPRNLTRTSGVAERDPSWSPDGKWVAYFSDATGEYELWIRPSDGTGEPRQLTQATGNFWYDPTWSPDSKYLAFTDKAGRYHLHDLESNETDLIDTDPWTEHGRISWSPDSRWFAYARSGDNQQRAIWLYNVEDDTRHQVTSGRFGDAWPTFDREGKYLYVVSSRHFKSPIYEDVGTTFVYTNTDDLLAFPLRAEVGSPLAPKSDEEKWDGANASDGNNGDNGDNGDKKADDDDDADHKKDDADKSDDDDGDKKEEVEPVEIELAGFEARGILLPVEPGEFYSPAVSHDGKLVYLRGKPAGVEGDPAVMILDLDPDQDKHEEKTVVAETDGFQMSADGKKLLIVKDGTMYLVKPEPDQKLEDAISTEDMLATIDPRTEWRQMFVDAWRMLRDFFYDPNMHEVDWMAKREQYAAMLDDCTSREDVAFVIGELYAELNVGHAYVRGGGDVEGEPSTPTGLLGADFELDDGAYRISHIYHGAEWDVDARGPLGQPGLDVKEGDYLLAVNRVPVDVSKDPWAAFQGLANAVVTLTVSEKPEMDDDARDVVVKTIGSESGLRYRAWIEKNRAYVAEQTDGRVGYIHVPDTGINGQNELFRQFYGQRDKDGLIIDERWNGGGQIPSRFIELLNRPVKNYWARRDGRDWPWPPDSNQGAKCMLINGLAGSGGDCFPYYFRQAHLGALIGMRTWGGLVGYSGNPQLIDGGHITTPTFAFYELDGTWGIEGYGVDPDIEVIDDPAKMVDGGDPQLDAAIAYCLREIRQHGYHPPHRPSYPDRSGMGIREQDK